MRYYCESCKSTIEVSYKCLEMWSEARRMLTGNKCPICGYAAIAKIPDYETPEQYEKRTGEPWPDSAPVWYWNYMMEMWLVDEYTCARVFRKSNVCSDLCHIVCAQSPVPPPDGWKPEDEKE